MCHRKSCVTFFSESTPPCAILRCNYHLTGNPIYFTSRTNVNQVSVRKIDLNDFHVATSETARDINRRILLNLIRKHQPVSRADLSRQSGLQRSTVSAITDELIADRWVKEGAVGFVPRGRKPIHLHLNEERAGIIGVNIRPSGTTLALAGLDTRFLSRDSMPSGHDPRAFIRELNRRISKLRKSHL